MKTVAGLDLSTTVAGFALMSEDGELISYDWHKFKKGSDYDLIDLVKQFDEHVWPEIKNADAVVLEDALKNYGGMTTTTSISVLLQFNAIIEYELVKRLGKDAVKKVHPSTAKKRSFLDRGRVPSSYSSPWSTYKDSKGWVIEEASSAYDIEWELTRSGNPRPGTDDAADAIVLASSYVEHNLQ
jgi:hypothetical protein